MAFFGSEKESKDPKNNTKPPKNKQKQNPKKEGLGNVRLPFGLPHLNLNLQKDQPKTKVDLVKDLLFYFPQKAPNSRKHYKIGTSAKLKTHKWKIDQKGGGHISGDFFFSFQILS